MFEGVVAAVLNRYLGKYIQDLDTENLNVGIFSGDVELRDLKLKPEALYELDLPIEVKVGVVSKISLHIPWGNLYTRSVIVSVEDVYVVAGPVITRPYDPDKEKRLSRASKRKKLEDLEGESVIGSGPPDSKNFFENLLKTIVNNLQIFICNIHIRYEDPVSTRDCPFACGVCVQNISVETTNNKWKPTITPQGASSLYQLIRMESFSIYWNPTCGDDGLIAAADPVPYWWNEMKKGIETFSIKKKDFDFIVKPITVKVKVIINKSNEARVPKLLVDFVLQDAATQLSRQQYLSIVSLVESFHRMNINRNVRQYHPGCGVANNSSKWWKYAYNAVLGQRIRPYSWQFIKKHREDYRNYKDTYKKTLLSPNDTELKLDLQQLEDHIAIIDIIIAREHAKIELHREEPDRIAVRENEVNWWGVMNQEPCVDLHIQTEKGRGLWAQLTAAEKKTLSDTIGLAEGVSKPKQYIEHKINFTLANCSVSLLNRRREILVITLTQFLASVETRPSAQAFKVSARAESFVVEGSSIENDLIPMITADTIHTGNTNTNFLAVDFEKNPLNSEADFGFGICMEPLEIVYHEHAVSEIINFFQTKSIALSELADMSLKHITHCAGIGRTLVEYTIARHKTFNINMDLKGPYIVIPELGSVQKGGSVVVLDLGRVVVRTELQPEGATLEDATQMELEERLYDRIHLDFTDLQLLFCDSGEEWRDAKKLQDTDHHLVPKIRCQIVFSNSIKPDYRQLPRHKLNISVSSVKLNLSDRKIGMILDFIDNLPLPSPNTVRVSEMDDSLIPEEEIDRFATDKICPECSVSQLLSIKRAVDVAVVARERRRPENFDKVGAKMAMLEVDKSFISSEHSDEEMELWARTVDLPGFDDNVSPRNVITMLLRFVVGELVVQLSRSNNRVDKAYLMLRVSKVCWDTAIMEYGPAVQASIGGIHLIDKIHIGPGGEYLELVSTDGSEDLATLLYRKVRADCPDFKSHFHSVEKSLVLDFTSVGIVFHREAFSALSKYLHYLFQKLQSRETYLKLLLPDPSALMTWVFTPTSDPPIPPGATKFSYSTRLGEIKVKMCDSDMEFLEIRVGGFESDCWFKANERMVLRIYLTSLSVDDLSDMTLYPKILTIDEDEVFELKYVRHNPKLYTRSNIDSNKDDVKSDGSFRLQIGRVHVVLLYKIVIDLQHFLEPFLRPGITAQALHIVEKMIEQQASQLRGWSTKLHLSLDIHAPTLLLPQKSASPNLIILNMGDFTVENFFKEVSSTLFSGSEPPVIDNVLVRLENLQMSRAIMTLAGSLEIQEPILEPVSVRLDVKRMLAYHHTVSNLPPAPGPYLQPNKDLLLYEVDGGIENILINLGQRDLATLLAVWSDNLAEGRFIDMQPTSHSSSPLEPHTPTNPTEDAAVRKLQAFFCQSEQVRREASIRLTFDGLQWFLFNDMDEVLSSPVRDLNHGLCKLDVGEAFLSLESFTDHSFELKTSLQCLLLEDIRPDNSVNIKKIFQSHGDEMKMGSGPISVSTPPIIDLTFRQTQSGDRNIDILVEKTRLNLSVSFFMNLGRFLMDTLPGERFAEGGVINHGYVGDTNVQSKVPAETVKSVQRPPSSADSTSGYFSLGALSVDDQPGLSLSIQLRKPEIMLFANLSQYNTHALLLQAEFLIDYSRHPGRDSLVCTLSGLQVLSKMQGHKRQPLHYVLYPCDVEFAKSLKSVEDGIKMTAIVSKIDVRLSASTVHTVSYVVEDITNTLQTDEGDSGPKSYSLHTEMEDLWSPKKVSPYIFPDLCDNIPYNQTSDPEGRPRETFTAAVPKIRVVFELEDGSHRTPVLVFKSSAESTMQDWSRHMHMTVEIQLQASYYNESVGAWEPLIEPTVTKENVYRPWEMLIKVFQAKAFPLSCRCDHERALEADRESSKLSHNTVVTKVADQSDTSADEAEPENGMTFIRRHNNDSTQSAKRNAHNESVSLVGYPDDSDSENEEGVLEKLASAMSHLFTGDTSDGEASESEDSSGAEPSVETEEASEMTMSCAGSVIAGREERAVFLKQHDESVDSGVEAEAPDRLALYVLIDARDRLEVTLTPAGMQVIHDLAASFTRTDQPVCPPLAMHSLDAPLVLSNDIGPGSIVTLTTKAEAGLDGKDKVLMFATYDKSDSLPSSPASTTAGLVDGSPQESDVDMESFEGGFSTSNTGTSGQELFSPVLTFPGETVTKLYKKITDERLHIDVEGFDSLHVLATQRSVSKLHLLQPVKNNTRYYVVVNVDIKQGHRKISVRSPLQIKNETSYAMGLYYKKPVLDGLGIEHIGESTNPFEDTIRVAIVEPDETFNVPLYVAYHCRLHILPAYVDSYNVSETGMWWQELASDLNTPKDIHCTPKEEKDVTVFSLRAMCVEGVLINRASRSIPNYLIRLLPPLAFHNRLPYAVEIKIPSIKYEVRIEAGEKSNVYFLNLVKMHKISIEVPVYLGIPWMGSFNLTADLEEKTVAMATEHDTEGGNKQLGLSLHVVRTETCDVYLHAPYWIVNKTGLPLQIRGSSSDVVYEAQGEEPLLFCYKKHRRRCVRLRAYHSSWSSAFSLDTAGCAGLVVCHDRERKRRYRILMTTTLSQLCPQLTRIITLLPNFLVTNESRKHIRFMEENERADMWIDLAPGQCVPFWPETDSMCMYVKFRDSKVVSQHFPITHVHQTVLRMDKGSGLCVSVTGGGDKPFCIALRNYNLGDAPVRVDNLCEDLFLKIHQQDCGQVALLSPYQSLICTWDDPTRERTLLWNVYNKKSKGFIADFWKDGFGQERVSFHTVKQSNTSNAVPATPTVSAKFSASLKRISPKSPVQDGSSSSDDTESDEQKPQQLKKTRKDKVIVYWVSYLEHHQRVLLFTQDERVAYQMRSKIDAERGGLELFLSLSGIGVSIGMESNLCQKELAYLSITDSSAIWEVMVTHRWKLLTLELASWIEDKWRQDHKKAQMKDYVHVDFEKMHMTKPFYGELRRRYYPGLWVQYRKSEHQTYVHCKMYRIQIDNQLHDAVFPTVLYPSPIPPHVMRRVGNKPCIEFAYMKRHRPLYNHNIYKFIKVLVQEFSLQLDKGFLLSMFGVWAKWQPEEKPSMRIRTDIAMLHTSLANIASKASSEKPKDVVEYVHLSPIKVQFSFSPRGVVHCKNVVRSFKADLIDFFINSFGATLAEVKGVKLKTAYFEQNGSLVNLNQLKSEIVCHYAGQMIQQFYVLVLGLDVLGNPYGLITDFTEGFGDFFYEPFLGMMEGPEEFAEGLSYGAQSLLGHVVGGPSASVSLISASLGNLLSSLSFDEDYKKKRRFCLQQSSDLPETLLMAGKSFTMGVALGLSGVIMKPVIGGHQEGVEGFFKGVGKGLMGLMTKPAGGVLDCIAMASDGIKRAAEMGEDVVMRTRLPRYMNPYTGVRPYSVHQATGMHLLNTLSKSHYSDSDIYWAHSPLTKEAKSNVLITLQHVFLVEKCRLWGLWDVEWVVRVDDIMAVPHVADNKLVFSVRQDDSLNFFAGDERYIECDDRSVLEWLQNKVETVLILNMEDKPCSAEL